MYRFLVLLLIVTVTLLIGQGFLRAPELEHPSPAGELQSLPSRHQLQRAAWNAEGRLILYAAADKSAAQIYERLLQPLAKTYFRGRRIEVFAADQAPDSLLYNWPVMLVGSSMPQEVIDAIAQLPALSWQDGRLAFENAVLEQNNTVAQLNQLPGAWRDTLPIDIIWGTNDQAITEQLQLRLDQGLRALFWSGWGYEVIESGQTKFVGYFNDTTWQMDRKIHFDFDQQPEAMDWESVADIQAFDGAAMPDKEWLEELRAVQKSICAFAGKEQVPPLNIKLYPTVERKALRTGSMEVAEFDDNDQAVHLVINDHFNGKQWGLQYCHWLRAALGPATTPLLEAGLAFQWVDSIQGAPWRSWVRQLALAEALPRPEELLNRKVIQDQFPLIGPLAVAAWVDYLLVTEGKAFVLENYFNNNTALQPTTRSYSSWTAWIQTNYPAKAKQPLPLPQQRLHGFTLAHEGYRIYNGYGGALAQQSLQAMQQHGIDAVAIVPYSYMANANRPDPIPVVERAGTENDEAVLFSHFSAKDLGQFTLLKPQIWLGGGSWPGDISFTGKKDWEAFFRYYKNWIMHYSLLAELYQIDALCAGTEMRHTTLEQPEMWGNLVKDIRQIYSGPLTYAANWGEECEKMSFWEAFDFIGINCYYPLSKGDHADLADLKDGAAAVVKKMYNIHRKADRPVWLTEIGYRSAEESWKNPHAEAADRAIDETAQANCYEAMLSATQNEDWIKGYFWWKWPSDMSHDESNGRGYMPLGKPAATVLEKYYTISKH
jgi:hypothetical protein